MGHALASREITSKVVLGPAWLDNLTKSLKSTQLEISCVPHTAIVAAIIADKQLTC